VVEDSRYERRVAAADMSDIDADVGTVARSSILLNEN